MEKENQIVEYQCDNKTIKSLEYFVNKLKVYVSSHNEDYILKSEFDEFTSEVINEANNYINQLYSSELLIYKTELIDIIKEKENEELVNNMRPKPISIDYKQYYERATTKIISIANKKIPMIHEEATKKYSDVYLLESKYKDFIELIEWCNNNGLSIIPDRIMFCAFMQITLETYMQFLSSPNEKVQSIFKAIENYIISLRLNAGEIGTRNSTAIKTNVSYDKVGHSLSPKDSGQTYNKNLIITNEDIFNKMRALGFDNNDFEKRKKESNVDVIDYTK